MKKILPLISFLLTITVVSAQVKIGDAPKKINPNALLELESQNKGMLIPRMTTGKHLYLCRETRQRLGPTFLQNPFTGRTTAQRKASIINNILCKKMAFMAKNFYLFPFKQHPLIKNHWHSTAVVPLVGASTCAVS